MFKGWVARDPLHKVTAILVFKFGKSKLPQWDIFTTILWTLVKIMLFILTSVVHRISLKMMPVIGMGRWWHRTTFVTYKINWLQYDDVIKWKHFPRYWPFDRGTHWSPVISPHKGQWRGALMLSVICPQINGLVKNRKAGDLRRHRTHYDVIVRHM